MQDIILASGSPRRRELLKNHFKLKVLVPKTDEKPLLFEKPQSYARRISANKWHACVKQYSKYLTSGPKLILSADTIVVLKNKILGKPRNSKEAKSMLKSLSGKKHTVLTSVTFGWSDKEPKTFLVSSGVEFRKLSDHDIDSYLRSGEWKGKAGAYGIQGKAHLLVHRINGSLTNIVGLPVYEAVRAVAHCLARFPKKA